MNSVVPPLSLSASTLTLSLTHHLPSLRWCGMWSIRNTSPSGERWNLKIGGCWWVRWGKQRCCGDHSVLVRTPLLRFTVRCVRACVALYAQDNIHEPPYPTSQQLWGRAAAPAQHRCWQSLFHKMVERRFVSGYFWPHFYIITTTTTSVLVGGGGMRAVPYRFLAAATASAADFSRAGDCCCLYLWKKKISISLALHH